MGEQGQKAEQAEGAEGRRERPGLVELISAAFNVLLLFLALACLVVLGLGGGLWGVFLNPFTLYCLLLIATARVTDTYVFVRRRRTTGRLIAAVCLNVTTGICGVWCLCLALQGPYLLTCPLLVLGVSAPSAAVVNLAAVSVVRRVPRSTKTPAARGAG